MKISDTHYKKKILHHVRLKTGDYYFFKNFIVSEVHEGVQFDWAAGEELLYHVYEFYGGSVRVGYISNRINSYNVVPRDWLKFYKEHGEGVLCTAIISYNGISVKNFLLEKIFMAGKVKHFDNLTSAIEWVKEKKKKSTKKISYSNR
ncbi:hypothetical protein GCM10009117_02840 [Gangjinia marincola]|uniref:STAS/SEC14 domain-containing protein n=1 Tax=Gangjinia marincola TaxID=578463 RepID=A0ABP3XS12_9FLAO